MVLKKQIRAAVIANRGGFSKASDSQIMTIWRALDKDTQEKYLQSIKITKAIDHEEREEREEKQRK